MGLQLPLLAASAVDQNIPLACDMAAMTPDQRVRYEQLIDHLRAHRISITEETNGYAYQFPGDAPTVLLLAELIGLEHLCCPFFHLVIEVGPGKGSAWLHVLGEGVAKALIQEELRL